MRLRSGRSWWLNREFATNRDKLGIQDLDLLAFLRRLHGDTPVHALTRLLTSPRNIKHVIRRTNRAWTALHGEIELDDLIVLTALRHGAPVVFSFLVDNIDPARLQPGDFAARNTEAAKKAWGKLVGALPQGDGVQTLVNLLGIQQLVRGGSPLPRQASPQGVQQSESADYFRRALSERLAPEEVRDQTILTDVENWKVSGAGPMMRHLLDPTDGAKAYLKAWEHFADRLEGAALLRIANTLIEAMLRDRQSSSSMQHPGLLAVWRQCNRRLPGDSHIEWLHAEIAKALPVSLNFANELFSYWGVPTAGATTGISTEGSAKVRAAFREATKRVFLNVETLVQSLSDERPYTLYRTICGSHGEGFEALEEWQWLADIALGAARDHRELMVPQIVLLLVDFEHGRIHTDKDGKSHMVEYYRLNVGRVNALFGRKVTEALTVIANAAGEQQYIADAVPQARALLKESEGQR